MSQIESKSIIEKKTFINKMFAKIAPKYDLLNNLMTFGMHNAWKEEAVKLALSETDDPKFGLDLCSGTGDLSIILKKYSPNMKVTSADNCLEMLNIAQRKFEKLGLSDIELLDLDCENIKPSLGSFDLITIGFGLRNLIDKQKFLSIVNSLLKPCGIFVCIDLGYPVNVFWQKIYFFYFYNVIPILGKIFASDKEAYTYLPASLATWYRQEDLKKLMTKSGFKRCYFKNILGGVVAVHVAVK